MEVWLRNSCSAARPPKSEHSSSRICSSLVSCLSSGRYQAAPNAIPRGTIVTLTSGFAQRSIQLMVACPASWYAMERFSSSVMILFLRSKPPTIRSTASMKSCLVTFFRPPRAAIKAASLQTFAISAPEKPGVCLLRKSISTLSSSFSGRRCTWNISLRSWRSGSSTCICRSNRPARRSAASSTSARLVAARMMTPEFVPNPSISVSSWFSVLSRSSLPPVKVFFPLARPIASISSMKIIDGAFSFA